MEHTLRLGGGAEAIERQHEKGRKTARERIAMLLDADAPSLELGLWAGFGVYDEWGGAPAAGVLTVIGSVSGRRVMVVANDATVKAGACFPLTIKKILRAQSIASLNFGLRLAALSRGSLTDGGCHAFRFVLGKSPFVGGAAARAATDGGLAASSIRDRT